MTEKYHVTPETLDQICARTVKQQMQRLAAEKHARDWPGEVETLLVALVERVVALETRIAERSSG